jgi:hypothetical protein
VLHRLCNQDSVKRIAMQWRQAGEMNEGGFVNGQRSNPVGLPLAGKIFGGSGKMGAGKWDILLFRGDR